MREKKLKCLIVTILFLMILAPSVCMAKTNADANDAEAPVRVGFFAFSGYHIIDEKGQRSGYGYDFLQKLAAHCDLTYEYEGYDSSYSDALDMLRDGKVDIVTSVSKTPEREEEFLFSDQDIGTNSTIFTVKSGNTDVIKGDYSTYDGLKIGMLDGNSKNANFEKFAKEHNFTFKPVYFETDSELSEALQEGKVEGAVTGSLRVLKDEWLVETFEATPFYVCVRKDRPDLMAEINAGIDELDLNEPNWRNTLHDKYYSTDHGGMIVMNAHERDYLNELKTSGTVLKVLANPDRAPYSYFQNGEAKGIFPSIFAQLAEEVGLTYEYIPVKNRDEYFQLLSGGEADIVIDYVNAYYPAEESGYKITKTFYEASCALLAQNDFSGEARTLAVIENSDLAKSPAVASYDPSSLVYCKSVDECVDAVRDGRADATILYAYTADKCVRDDVKNQLSYTVTGEEAMPYSIGVRADAGHQLLSLLDKAITSLSDAQRSRIVNSEVGARQRSGGVSLMSFLYSNPVYVLLVMAVILLLLFAVAMAVVRTRNQYRLQEEVAQATSQLEAKTEELSKALEAADAANRAKTSFLNNMSHDIRTPMNAIIGFTALATTHLDNRERTEDYLSKIAQASNHLLSLINDVLDMSRIESGNVTIEERPENLADILQGLRNIIQSDIHAKRLELFIDTVDVTDEEIFCDKLRLNQVLLNLISNAIKFTDVGGSVSIRVTQKPSEKEEHGVYEFRVRDTGIGMSEEFIKTIFDPFTRERNSTVSGIKGTGLGMAITKNIVDMMHGTIEVHSEKGEGTEFIVNLELRFALEHRDIGAIDELSGFRALVVDDDLVSCQSVSKMLRKIGMRAEWTLTGRAAVARTAEAIEMEDPFEVYIIDWSMPEMNGIETVRRIREIIGEESPIILMSAYDWADIETEARKAGVTGFISKPLFASDLHRTLQKSLGKTQEEPQKTASMPREEFAKKRILLAEDNELNQEIAMEILSEAGFEVECANDGREAVDALCNAPAGYFDLILMDIQMPIMDGYTATKEIRALEDPVLSKIPIIAMTANAFEEDRMAALEAGMDGHLPKPIDVERMMALLSWMFSEDQ